MHVHLVVAVPLTGRRRRGRGGLAGAVLEAAGQFFGRGHQVEDLLHGVAAKVVGQADPGTAGRTQLDKADLRRAVVAGRREGGWVAGGCGVKGRKGAEREVTRRTCFRIRTELEGTREVL